MSFFTGDGPGRTGQCPRCGMTCEVDAKGQPTLHRAPTMASETWCLYCPGTNGREEFERALEALRGQIVAALALSPQPLVVEPSGECVLLPMPALERLTEERLTEGRLAVERLAQLVEPPPEKTLVPAPERRTRLAPEPPAEPEHLCRGGTEAFVECSQCQYVFHCEQTGRTPPQTYAGWRHEFVNYGGEYPKNCMLAQVTVKTRCVIDPPDPPEQAKPRGRQQVQRDRFVLAGVAWCAYSVANALAAGTTLAAVMVFVSMWFLLVAFFVNQQRRRP